MKSVRKAKMIQLFFQKNRITNYELCDYFQVSIETVRRDLADLEKEGLIQRVYGGAVRADITTSYNETLPWKMRSSFMLNEKKAIMQEAVRHISDNSVVAIDAGTTLQGISKHLVAKKNLSILTNDLRIAYDLTENTSHNIYMIGGSIRRDDFFTSGYLAINFINFFSHIDVALVTADAFKIATGLCDYAEEVQNLKQTIINKADKVIPCFDHTKFERNAPFCFCSTSRPTCFITDDKVSPEIAESLKARNLPFVFVKTQDSLSKEGYPG